VNELVYLKADDVFTDSMVIANGTENQHKSVVAIIKKYRRDFEGIGQLRFSDLKSTNPKGGRPTKVYWLNEEQAMLLVTYLDNNEIVRNFKKNLVHQFVEMRKFIAERHTQAWVETRQQGKITRKAETDVIQELVAYAKEQGSTHSNMLYMTYSKLANSMCGIKGRDNATTYQLNNLSIFENLILQMIRSGMNNGLDYKQIYQECKNRCMMAQEVAMIGG
jgi:phage regulator Rha-like protein